MNFNITYKQIIENITDYLITLDNVQQNLSGQQVYPINIDTAKNAKYPDNKNPFIDYTDNIKYGDKHSTYQPYYTVSIINPVILYKEAVIKNLFKSYYTTILNGKDINSKITSKIQLLAFINDLISYYCNSVCYIHSKYTKNVYLIYNPKKSIDYNIDIGEDYAEDILKNEDINITLMMLFNNLHTRIRSQVIRYHYNIN